jgi:hypothetical protein
MQNLMVMRAIVLSAFALCGCANPTSRPIDTRQTAKVFVEACMGEWVHLPPASGDDAGAFRLKLHPDGRFEAEFGKKKLTGEWQGFGTLDAGVRMTDSRTGEELEIVECPLNHPTVMIDGHANEYRVRRPS